jgi:hypothetical protein
MGPKPNLDWGSAQADRPPGTMPADFNYPPVPTPASNKPVILPLPIRVICGSDEEAGEFVPDPNIVSGSMNHSGSTIDTSAPHAAPAAVYQSECYGNDLTYSFPVPKDDHYLVRLHFAEVFDNGAGNRLENIAINGQWVLTNFDIFADAGGMNKALVKEFPDVVPDDQGNIAIRIVTAPDSPDHNAKINGIEILRPGDAAREDVSNSFTVKTVDGKADFTIDTTAAPELRDWAQNQLAPVLAENYPKIVALLPSKGYTAPTHFTITLKPIDGVAYTAGTDVTANSVWLKSEIGREAIGSLVHECVHVVQQYGDGSNGPGWLVEGMADYFRWFKYEPQSHGADIVWMRHLRHFKPEYDASYRVSANFLNWVSEKYDPDLVTKLSAAMRDGNYSDDIWKQITGKSMQDLGAEWKKDIETQLAAG